MVELDQFKYTLQTYEKPLLEVKDSLDLVNKEKRIAELDRHLEEPDFWNDPDKSTAIVRELKNLKDTVDLFRRLENEYEEIGDMIEMGY